jgi:hypothetical protein
MRTLSVEIRVGEALRMDGQGSAVVTLEHKSGQRARLKIEADEGVRIRTPSRGPSMGSLLAESR